jgi:hypothetical protein
VICQDTNNLLRYVVERDGGGNPEHLPALDGGMCPEMPKKEDGIDFIFGGRQLLFFSLRLLCCVSDPPCCRPAMPGLQSSKP